MDVRDELLTAAEIAIGLAGFAGVAAVFLQRSDQRLIDRLRFVNLFVLSFATVILAWVPLVIERMGYAGDALWSRSSAVMLLFWFLNAAIASRVYRGLGEITEVDFRLPMSLALLPGLISLAVQIVNLGGFLWTPQYLAYLFGIFAYLYSTALSFVYVVLFRPSE